MCLLQLLARDGMLQPLDLTVPALDCMNLWVVSSHTPFDWTCSFLASNVQFDVLWRQQKHKPNLFGNSHGSFTAKALRFISGYRRFSLCLVNVCSSFELQNSSTQECRRLPNRERNMTENSVTCSVRGLLLIQAHL